MVEGELFLHLTATSPAGVLWYVVKLVGDGDHERHIEGRIRNPHVRAPAIRGVQQFPGSFLGP